MYTIKNVRAGTAAATRERTVADKQVAINSAKATSEFFHGVYEVSSEKGAFCYFVNGRKYLKIDTALARA